MDKRILIVDDDTVFCEELADFLLGAGFVVECALTPEDGLELLARTKYDVLLLDYKMPRINGLEFLETSKAGVSCTKVLLMSGSLAVSKMVEDLGLSAYVALVLQKPFNTHDLLNAIESSPAPS